MKRISTFRLVSGTLAALALVLLAVSGSMALAAQDRYTLKLGKLSFSDFRGYENWKDVQSVVSGPLTPPSAPGNNRRLSGR